jgi:hypothetical protein
MINAWECAPEPDLAQSRLEPAAAGCSRLQPALKASHLKPQVPSWAPE